MLFKKVFVLELFTVARYQKLILLDQGFYYKALISKLSENITLFLKKELYMIFLHKFTLILKTALIRMALTHYTQKCDETEYT